MGRRTYAYMRAYVHVNVCSRTMVPEVNRKIHIKRELKYRMPFVVQRCKRNDTREVRIFLDIISLLFYKRRHYTASVCVLV